MKTKWRQIIVGTFLLSCITLVGCGERVIPEKLLEAEAGRFCYEGSSLAWATTVAEDGTVYTADVVYSEEAGAAATQIICSYALDGTESERQELIFGHSSVRAMCVEENNLYAITEENTDGNGWESVLHRISLETWEVVEIARIKNVYRIKSLEYIKDCFYFLGKSSLAQQKEYELHPEVAFYQYDGEIISCFSERNGLVELSVDFPIAMASTQKGTLLIYVYNEEHGFGFLEYQPKRNKLHEVVWRNHGANLSFDACGTERDYLYFEQGKGADCILTFVDMETGTESELTEKIELKISGSPVYTGGFVFFGNGNSGKQERIGVAGTLKSNRALSFLTTTTMELPFGCGYGMEQTELSEEEFAMKVLALDEDFDLCYLSSRDSIAYNIRENGTFYPLNEVPGVMEYLEACFPYVKEAARKEDGSVWMLPVSVTIPGVVYNEECWEKYGLPNLDNQSFEEFLELADEVQHIEGIPAVANPYLLTECFLMQYVNGQREFDTEEFRKEAACVKDMYEKSVDWNYTYDIGKQIGKEKNLEFLFFQEMYRDSFLWYKDYLHDCECIRVTGISGPQKSDKNLGTCIFLAVNPQSERLSDVLEYISAYCKYRMGEKDTLLFEGLENYTDTVYMQEVYTLYENGEIYFEMDAEIYTEPFWEYLNGSISLEEMISEADRRKSLFLGE